MLLLFLIGIAASPILFLEGRKIETLRDFVFVLLSVLALIFAVGALGELLPDEDLQTALYQLFSPIYAIYGGVLIFKTIKVFRRGDDPKTVDIIRLIVGVLLVFRTISHFLY